MLLSAMLWTGAKLFLGAELVRFVISPIEADEPDPEPGHEPPQQEQPPAESDDSSWRSQSPLILSSSALALSLVGFALPPARLLSAPVLLVGILPTAVDAGRTTLDKRTLDFGGLTTVGTLLELWLGYNTLASFGWVVFAWGQRLQLRARNRVMSTFESAFEQVEEQAWVLRDGVELEVPLRDISNTDLVVLRTGDLVPVDGDITEGVLTVDEHLIVGQRLLSRRGVGEALPATAMVIEGRALLRPARTGDETVLARIDSWRALAQSYEQQLSDRAALEGDRSVRATLGMMALGLASGGLPGLLSGHWTNAIELSWFGAPFSTTNTIEAAAQRAMIIKDGRSLELLSEVDTVVLSKTGTLHDFRVADIHAAPGHDRAQILALCAGLESCARAHPIGRAILHEAQRLATPASSVSSCSQRVGAGVQGVIDGRALLLGSRQLFESEQLEAVLETPELHALRETTEAKGRTLVHLAVDGAWAGSVELAPRLRPQAKAVLDDLRARGLELILISGDERQGVVEFAKGLGIERVESCRSPAHRHALMLELQAEGRRVCFVGDGPTDAPALRAATVSVALFGASPIAIHSAQIFIRGEELSQLTQLFELREQFALEQFMIVSTARVITLANGLGFLLSSTSLSALVWLYMSGLVVIGGVAIMPTLRALTSEAREEMLLRPAKSG